MNNLKELETILKNIEFGEVIVKIQNGQIVMIEETKKHLIKKG